MSSHHVVRENQEPALLIEDLFLIEEEDLGQLLEWSPTLVIGNNTVDALEARGYKFDVILTKIPVNHSQENVKVVSYHANFLESALAYLVENHYHAVNIITDKIDFIRYLPYLSQINIVLLSGGMRYYFVTTGFTKWKASGESIRLYTLNQEITTNGLRRVSDNLYETTQDGLFKLEFSTLAYILVGETIS